MTRDTRVSVAGLALNDDFTDPDLHWLFTKIDGWYDGPGLAVDQQQRLTAHGQFPIPGRRTGRVVTIDGRVMGRRAEQMAAVVDQLSALLAGGQFGRLSVTDFAGEKHAQVQLAAPPTTDWATGSPIVRYQLQLLAPDPYRYGTLSTSTVGLLTQPAGIGAVWPAFPTPGPFSWGSTAGLSDGVARVRNVGNADAVPKLSIVGPAPAAGFKITRIGGAEELTYLGDLPAGSKLVISPRDGTAILDGVADRTSSLIVTRWPKIPAGGLGEFLFQSLGGTTAAQLTAETEATYW